MSKPLRAGLIGCGGIAGAHMRAYRQLEGVEGVHPGFLRFRQVRVVGVIAEGVDLAALHVVRA